MHCSLSVRMKRSATPLHSRSPTYDGEIVFESVEVNWNTGCVDLPGKFPFPGRVVEPLVQHSGVVRGHLHRRVVQNAYAPSAQAAQEEAHLQKDVLASARSVCVRLCLTRPATIIRGHQHHSEPDVGVGLKLFNDCPIHVGLLVENNGLKVQSFQDPRYRLLGFLVVPVDKEDPSAKRHRGSGRADSARANSLLVHNPYKVLQPCDRLLDTARSILAFLLFYDTVIVIGTPGNRRYHVNQRCRKGAGLVRLLPEKVTNGAPRCPERSRTCGCSRPGCCSKTSTP